MCWLLLESDSQVGYHCCTLEKCT
uniref:Uncharacterized protein n=1 Tax=Anguilla anguilla TaxID=7936 RepID=A0A0E9RPJ2_ANGAN